MSAPANPPKPSVAGVALAAHDALPAGTRFGEFEIISVLGVGGFGIVYLAQDHSLERQVALKEYMPAALASRGAGARITIRAGSFAETFAVGLRSFINEARLLARFDHPSLVKVYRFWEDNGTAYMVMPYLEGRTLRDARRAMVEAPDEAWIRGVLEPTLDALELLHREGVFHRDIAPDNILLPPEGPPILLDFGAARRVISDRTQSLTAILKPSYAPIEQYAEMATMRQGPWTDLYALGAVLHYLLFGVPPPPAIARAVQPDAESIEQRIVPGVSPRFISMVAWMLGVRPLERPQNVASLRAALDGRTAIPSSVRHDVTVPGDTALMQVAPSPSLFAPTAIEAPFYRTVPVAGLYSAATRVEAASAPAALKGDPAHRSMAPVTRNMAPQTPGAAPAVDAAFVSMPASGPGSAPMRSTPPGRPPPAYVPTAHLASGNAAIPDADAHAVPRAPDDPVAAATRSSRRGRVLVAGVAAVAVALAVLWQFVGVIGGSRLASAPPVLADSVAEAAGARSAGPRTVVQADVAVTTAPLAAASERQTERMAASAAMASTVPTGSAGASSGAIPATQPSSAQAGNRLRPKRNAPPRSSSHNMAKAPTAGPKTARAACGDRNFISLAICIDRECEQPKFRNGTECVKVLEVKRQRAQR